ncbi:hypothetical protein [Paenibacillus polymyxa]|uniref:hypothetical protein n=1 Tax=Paenibacillus polymyxa TaxID=1406 RepID=UPI0015D63026|nr:hypothetical protein [Paenibacillus polymyxa]
MELGLFVVVNSLGEIVAKNLSSLDAVTDYIRDAEPGKYGACQLVATFDKPTDIEELCK